jgi:hypothetical protein
VATTSLLTIGMITRKAIALFRNTNAFVQMLDRQYDSSFSKTGAKIGSQLKIRLPNEYVVRIGPTAVPQATQELQTTLTVASYLGVDASFGSVDLALSMDDFAYRVLAPMVNTLVGGVANTIMAGAESINNFVHNTSGSATISPIAATWLQAGAVLTQNSCPKMNRGLVVDPLTMARTVTSLTGLFNPQNDIGKQYKTGLIAQNVLGFDWAEDQLVLLHTEGTFTSGTLNGANQSGSTITVSSTGGTLNVGDIITIAGVFQVNRVTKTSLGSLQQFVITVAAPAASTSLSIYPAIIAPVSTTMIAQQTVSAIPATSAAIATPVAASEQYRKNFGFHPTAVTMVTADLEMPNGATVSEGREAYDGVSMRMTRNWLPVSDLFLTRLDVLFGSLWVRPEWAVVVADAV